jgi:hypothetical protein
VYNKDTVPGGAASFSSPRHLFSLASYNLNLQTAVRADETLVTVFVSVFDSHQQNVIRSLFSLATPQFSW